MNTKSDTKNIVCGVPQGSILGPLLFLVYINDLCFVSNDLYKILFADDTNVFIAGKNLKNIVSKMNNGLVEIVDWLKANRLSLNVNKTNFMLFNRNNKINTSDLNININGNKINEVNKVKFLGVILDNQVSWKDHISYSANKMSKCIGILYKARPFLNKIILYIIHFYIHT